MSHWPECIDIWHGASLGLGFSSLFNDGHVLRGHSFISLFVWEETGVPRKKTCGQAGDNLTFPHTSLGIVGSSDL